MPYLRDRRVSVLCALTDLGFMDWRYLSTASKPESLRSLLSSLSSLLSPLSPLFRSLFLPLTANNNNNLYAYARDAHGTSPRPMHSPTNDSDVHTRAYIQTGRAHRGEHGGHSQQARLYNAVRSSQQLWDRRSETGGGKGTCMMRAMCMGRDGEAKVHARRLVATLAWVHPQPATACSDGQRSSPAVESMTYGTFNSETFMTAADHLLQSGLLQRYPHAIIDGASYHPQAFDDAVEAAGGRVWRLPAYSASQLSPLDNGAFGTLTRYLHTHAGRLSRRPIHEAFDEALRECLGPAGARWCFHNCGIY